MQQDIDVKYEVEITEVFKQLEALDSMVKHHEVVDSEDVLEGISGGDG